MWYRIFWLILLCPLLASAEERTLTLERAIDEALRDAPEIAASNATLEGAETFAPSAGRLPDPELVTGVDNLPVSAANRFSLTRDFMTMRKVGVMQSFPNREKRRLQGERARQDVGIAQGEMRKTRFDTARAVAEAWIASAVAEQSITRLESLKPDVELQATAARAALSSGRENASEALGAQSLVAALNERILSLRQEAQMQRAELARWLAHDADLPLAALPVDRQLEHSPDALVAAISEHAPLAPVVARLDAARTDVDLARAQKRPDWSAEVSYAQRGPDFSNMVSLEFRVGLPLFPKERQNRAVGQKLAAVRAQESELAAQVRMHTAEVRAAVVQWQLGRERLQNYAQEFLPLARDRSRTALASYRAGRGDLRSVADTLTEEINAQLEELQLQGSVARAWVFLHLLHESGAPQ